MTLALLALSLSALPIHASIIEEDHAAVAADGWRIALHRWRPLHVQRGEPVLLTHGFIENRRIWDLDAERSLARRLAERGFDVWTMELRGTSPSREREGGRGSDWAFSIDDFVRQDAPAAIDTILRGSGSPQILMVGHSLGGLITYATLQGPLAPRVKAAVTLAGVGTMSGGELLEPRLQKFFALLGLTLGPVLPADAPFPIGSVLHRTLGNDPKKWEALARLLDSPLGAPFWEPENVTPEILAKLLRESVSNTSFNVVRQFLRYAKEGKVEGVTDRLSEIRAPVLALAGAEDKVIPASDVRKVAALAGAEYIELPGVGHEDICIGLKSPTAVYPLVIDFLEKHSSPHRPPHDRRALPPSGEGLGYPLPTGEVEAQARVRGLISTWRPE